MLISDDDDSTAKLIDFGMMISIPYPDETIVCRPIVGTEGYFAPESLTKVNFQFFSYLFFLTTCMLCRPE